MKKFVFGLVVCVVMSAALSEAQACCGCFRIFARRCCECVGDETVVPDAFPDAPVDARPTEESESTIDEVAQADSVESIVEEQSVVESQSGCSTCAFDDQCVSFFGGTVTKDVQKDETGVTTTTKTIKRNGIFGNTERTVTVIEGNGTEYEQRVLSIINDYRSKAGLPALEWDETIARDARSHSTWINSGGWGHAPGHMECIARGAMSPESLAYMWLNSPPHRAIIMSRTSRAGIACIGHGHTLRVR